MPQGQSLFQVPPWEQIPREHPLGAACLLYYELTTTSGWSHQNTVLVGVPDNLTASLQACKIGLSETYRARVRRRRSTYSSNVNSPASASTGPIGGYVHSPHTNRGRPLAMLRAIRLWNPVRAVHIDGVMTHVSHPNRRFNSWNILTFNITSVSSDGHECKN